MTTRFIQTLESLTQEEAGDSELLSLVREGRNRTQAQLKQATDQNEQFSEYLALQQHIGQQAEQYLSDSQSAYQKFQAALRNPSGSTLMRLGNAVTGGKFFKPQLDAAYVGSTLLDLFESSVHHKEQVETSRDLLDHRRTIIYDISRFEAELLADQASAYHNVQGLVGRMKPLHTILRTYRDTQDIDLGELKQQLIVCDETGLFQGTRFDPSDLIARLDAGDDVRADLYLVETDVDQAYREKDAIVRRAGLEVKGASTAIQGLALQRDQFEATVSSMDIQVAELNCDLRSTQYLAQNTYHLMVGQEVSQAAMNAFEAYKGAMNAAQRFNSLGASVMLDRLGFILTTPFFDPENLAQAKEDLDTAVGLFAQQEQRFHQQVQTLVSTMGLDTSLSYER